MAAKKTHCPWCSRDGVLLTSKGGLGNHCDASGKKCVGVGMQVSASSLTPPKKIYPTYSRKTGKVVR